MHLYRWADETVVREAKRMVSTNSSHIPKKKLIEMIDMGQGGAEPSTVKETKEKLASKTTDPAEKERRRERRRERMSRRKTTDVTGLQLSDNKDIIETNLSKISKEVDTNLTRTNSVSSTDGILGGDTNLRVASPQSVMSDIDSKSSGLTQPHKFEPSSYSRVRSPETTVSPVSGMRSPHSSSRSQSRESGICSPERPQSRTGSQTRSRSPDNRSSSRPLSPASKASSRALSPAECTSPRMTSPSIREVDGNNNEDLEGNVSTCKYDGVEMRALDIEHINFNAIRPAVPDSISAMNQAVDELAEQSGSYSDNEKQLLEQMKRMRLNHESTVVNYEEQISKLMTEMEKMKSMLETRTLESGAQGDGSGTLLLTDRAGELQLLSCLQSI